MKASRELLLFAIACLSGIAVVVGLSGSISGQAPTKKNLNVQVGLVHASYEALKETPIMVSVIKDGEVILQQEVRNNSSPSFALVPGLYDVRLEGEGMQTQVKRGILVKAEPPTTIIGGPMQQGTGVKIIEYGTTGLSREEVAARLTKLEAAVGELQKARQAR